MNKSMLTFSKNPIYKCPFIEGKELIKKSYYKYNNDESRIKNDIAEKIFFPENISQISWAICNIRKRKENAVISSSRTGIVGGACLKNSKNIISLERMAKKCSIHKDNKGYFAKCSPGITLSELNGILKKYKDPENPTIKLFFPVDPTEQSASIGGMTATNASGARTLFYGSMRKWVKSITLIDSYGYICKIKRGDFYSNNLSFSVSSKNGIEHGILPKIPQLQVKNTAGYYSKENMDLIDLFIGSEGTLAIIGEIELFLEKVPEMTAYIMLFPQDSLHTSQISMSLKKIKSAQLIAIEYMDMNSIFLLKQRQKEFGQASKIPKFPENTAEIIYCEFNLNSEKDFSRLYSEICSNLPFLEINRSWAGFSTEIHSNMKHIRHCVPEIINQNISSIKKSFPDISKIGTDLSVPDKSIDKMLSIYKTALIKNKLRHAIFGHLGNGHLHVNIIPEDIKQYYKSLELVYYFSEKAVELGGSISAEHGIGRLKKKYMKIQFSDKQLKEMRKLKKLFDPDSIFNDGVML